MPQPRWNACAAQQSRTRRPQLCRVTRAAGRSHGTWAASGRCARERRTGGVGLPARCCGRLRSTCRTQAWRCRRCMPRCWHNPCEYCAWWAGARSFWASVLTALACWCHQLRTQRLATSMHPAGKAGSSRCSCFQLTQRGRRGTGDRRGVGARCGRRGDVPPRDVHARRRRGPRDGGGEPIRTLHGAVRCAGPGGTWCVTVVAAPRLWSAPCDTIVACTDQVPCCGTCHTLQGGYPDRLH